MGPKVPLKLEKCVFFFPEEGLKSRSPKGDKSLLRRLFGQNWSPFTKKVSNCSKY